MIDDSLPNHVASRRTKLDEYYTAIKRLDFADGRSLRIDARNLYFRKAVIHRSVRFRKRGMTGTGRLEPFDHAAHFDKTEIVARRADVGDMSSSADIYAPVPSKSIAA